MKISTNTLNILKWLSTINSGIKIDVGNKLYSKFEANSMCAMVEVEETFPNQFITANLSKFLALVDLFEDPDFEFTDEYVKISSPNGKNKTHYYQSRPELVTQPNKIPKVQTEIALSFSLSSENLKKIFKACSVPLRIIYKEILQGLRHCRNRSILKTYVRISAVSVTQQKPLEITLQANKRGR